ncbi:integration host factor subunit alpha [Betaproteobacteria bacterium]|nr:integration host factor subunit alpha [Betaproteobacteria bacterium]
MSIEQSEEDNFLSVNKTITKADLADYLFEKVGLNKREAKEFVDLFFEELRSALISGESIKLTGFGNFDIRKKSERPGRNPKTGQQIPVTARKVVTFHASQKLKERMQ